MCRRVGIVILCIALVSCTISAWAADGDIGYLGPSYSGASNAPTGEKVESKLWWNDGFWWGSLFDAVSQDYHIFRLELATQTWIDTGVLVDERSASKADVLWDGTYLYIASHIKAIPPVQGGPSRLYRFSYNPATKGYSRDPGFPVTINSYKTETLVIDKDSTGKLWATWMQDNQIYVNRTVGDDLIWGTPFAIPVSGSTVSSDDISSVIAFGGDKIGVLWSNQLDQVNSAVYFAVHVDGQPDTVWEPSRKAIQGRNITDDHLNLKSFQSDGTGRVYAAIKTSLSERSAPLIMLLVRDPASGDWSSHVFGQESDEHTRPILLLDEENRVIHMFATGPRPPNTILNPAGTIYEKTSPIDPISFPQGYGTPVIQDAGGPNINNVTSTKQNLNSTTGLVVMASNDATRQYRHAYQPLAVSPPAPPTAAFSGTPTIGTAPLTVSFSDLSSGNPTGWGWDFEGDGVIDATVQNPQFTYTTAGTYTVSLTVSNTSGSDTHTEIGYIAVSPSVPPTAAFNGTPTIGTTPLTVSFSDLSSGNPTGWGWDFEGDGVIDTTVQNPQFTYTTAGTYTVSLMVSNASGSGTHTEIGYIAISPPAPPTAAFNGTPTIGTTPLTVSFSDLSSGNPTGWGWDFESDGVIDATVQNPQFTYTTAGTYTVSLMVTSAGGSDTHVENDFIMVSAPPPPTAAFSGAPRTGTAPLTVSFSDLSSDHPTGWGWDFEGDGVIDATVQNPQFTYTTAGTYTVTLRVTNANGSDTHLESAYVNVTPPPVTLIFAPVADARVKSDSPDKNYGRDTTLRVRQAGTAVLTTQHSYLTFSVSGVVGPVVAAKLQLFVVDSSDDGGRIFPVSSSWVESTITWNNAPPISGSSLSSAGAVSVGTWVELDLGASIAGNETYSFALTSLSTNDVYYSSREGSNPPRLVITQSP